MPNTSDTEANSSKVNINVHNVGIQAETEPSIRPGLTLAHTGSWLLTNFANICELQRDKEIENSIQVLIEHSMTE